MPKLSSAEKQKSWEEKILQQRQSGLSVQRWCQEHQINPHTFQYWKEKLFPKATLSRSSFAELSSSPFIGIILECQGVHIHLDKHFDPSTLKHCLQVLKEIA